MNVYIVCEKNYYELVLEGNEPIDIIGVFDTKEKAMAKFKEQFESYKTNCENYILDEELTLEDVMKKGFARMFYGYQENWNCYFELDIIESEVL